MRCRGLGAMECHNPDPQVLSALLTELEPLGPLVVRAAPLAVPFPLLPPWLTPLPRMSLVAPAPPPQPQLTRKRPLELSRLFPRLDPSAGAPGHWQTRSCSGRPSATSTASCSPWKRNSSRSCLSTGNSVRVRRTQQLRATLLHGIHDLRQTRESRSRRPSPTREYPLPEAPLTRAQRLRRWMHPRAPLIRMASEALGKMAQRVRQSSPSSRKRPPRWMRSFLKQRRALVKTQGKIQWRAPPTPWRTSSGGDNFLRKGAPSNARAARRRRRWMREFWTCVARSTVWTLA
mmetsp:Transcript_76013/g.211185  ORF Transcript_76013/g.211185 Transcript_76013/m.211185 type:complete len:289 (-) Transcript_76013:261-1127(-)